jgi:leucyl-tRNA synthetase
MARQQEKQMNGKEAYEYVIADLEQDIGWDENAMETTLSILKQRLHLIVDVHPTLFDETPDPTDNEAVSSWITGAFEAVVDDPRNTNIVDELQNRFDKFNQDNK